MKVQRETARKARKVTNYMGADATVYESIDPSVTSEFVGYDRLIHTSEVTVMTTDTEVTEALSDGESGTIFVRETPFYATMGGQNADTGEIRSADGSFVFCVEDTVNLPGGRAGHIGRVISGMVKTGDTVLVLEIMKMETPVVATEDGTVASINVNVGEMVEAGALLATLNN